jgi:hypothetical protein
MSTSHSGQDARVAAADFRKKPAEKHEQEISNADFHV